MAEFWQKVVSVNNNKDAGNTNSTMVVIYTFWSAIYTSLPMRTLSERGQGNEGERTKTKASEQGRTSKDKLVIASRPLPKGLGLF